MKAPGFYPSPWISKEIHNADREREFTVTYAIHQQADDKARVLITRDRLLSFAKDDTWSSMEYGHFQII